MIDPIGFKPADLPDPVHVAHKPVDAAARVERVTLPPVQVPPETGARVIAKAYASAPPVDLERVQQIKRAVQQGRFPIVPARIADRLIAAQLNWAAPDETR